jgi:hypothetical protein
MTINLSPNAVKVFEGAKEKKTEFEAIDASHLSPDDRRALAQAGLSFTVDRNRKVLAHYPSRMRQEDLRRQVMEKRQARIA